MEKKQKERIYAEFRDRKNTLVMGVLCSLYFGLMLTSNLGALARIMPPLPLPIFIGLALFIFGGQIFVWRKLRLLQWRWFLDFFSILLFFCEYAILLFVLLFLSWPIYFLVDYVVQHGRPY